MSIQSGRSPRPAVSSRFLALLASIVVLVPVSAAAAGVTASKSCLTSPCTVVEAKFTLASAQTIQWQAAYTGTPTQGHSFYLSTVASNLADIPLTTSGQTGGTKFLPAGTYHISIRLALMGPGTYTVFYNPSLAAGAGAASEEASPGSVRVSEEQAARLQLRVGAGGDARAEIAARDVLRALGPTLGASPRDELRLLVAADDTLGQTHLRLRQHVDGLPVIGAELIVHLDTSTRRLRSLEGRFLPSADLRTEAALGGVAAIEALRATSGAQAGVDGEPEQVFVLGPDGRGRLAWAGEVDYIDAHGERQLDRVFVDAGSGAELERHPLLQRALDREVWDAQNGTNEAGVVRVIDEGGSSADGVAQNAYDFSGAAWDYFRFRQGWDSYNNAGSLIRSTVHLGVGFNNAFWDGSAKRLVFGDGDGVQFDPFPNGLDVVAHELTHGVTQHTAGLVYSNESGALNEAMSDIFGAAAEARARGLSANTWLVGEDVFTPGIGGDALRIMNNPTLDGTSRDYYPERFIGSADNGGVHSNSGIANLAFFLASQGGTHPRGKTAVVVRSIGMNAAEDIFFRALRFHMGSGETFAQARQHTAQAARELFGHNAVQHRAICEAWDAVGVPGTLTGECLTVGDGLPAPASVSAFSERCRGLNTASWSSVPGATRYEVWGSTSATDFFTASRFYSGSALSALISVPGNRYIRVKACDAVSCGPYSVAYAVATRISGCL